MENEAYYLYIEVRDTQTDTTKMANHKHNYEVTRINRVGMNMKQGPIAHVIAKCSCNHEIGRKMPVEKIDERIADMNATLNA